MLCSRYIHQCKLHSKPSNNKDKSMQETVNSDKNLCKTGSVVRIPQLLQTKQTERLQSIFANSSICQRWHIRLFLSRFAREKLRIKRCGHFCPLFRLFSILWFHSCTQCPRALNSANPVLYRTCRRTWKYREHNSVMTNTWELISNLHGHLDN